MFSLPGEVKWYMLTGLLLYELGALTFMQVIGCISFTSVLWNGAISFFYKTGAYSPIIITFQVFVEWKSYLFKQNHSELHGSGAGIVKKTGIAVLLCICLVLIQLYSRYSRKESMKNESYLLFKVKIARFCTNPLVAACALIILPQ